MTPPRFGTFLIPDAQRPELTVDTAVTAERLGLDLIGIQDHPYQRRFLDTLSLLAFIAARTERITLAPDVVNLPLRPPAVLAKAAATIDVLSGAPPHRPSRGRMAAEPAAPPAGGHPREPAGGRRGGARRRPRPHVDPPDREPRRSNHHRRIRRVPPRTGAPVGR
jgi:hypothetical protein